jgi:3-methyladenine DNA glycosylase AlkC
MLMKDGVGPAAVGRMAAALAAAHDGFDAPAFRRDALHGLDALELKQRVSHVIGALQAHLPSRFEEAAGVLEALVSHWDRGDTGDPLRGFAAWPLIDYVAVQGLEQPHVALPLLRRLTPLFSAEFAIRSFIERHFDVTRDYLRRWCDDPDADVRRLVSEGTRPRLPWGRRLHRFVEDPAPVLELLEALRDDSSEYVRRSVANNINDISRDHPDLAVDVCRGWLEGAGDGRRRIVRHALRTLVKAGHPEVFPLLGFEDPGVTVRHFGPARATVRMGQSLPFTIVLDAHPEEPARLVVDYAVHYRRANGRMAPKVFKLRRVEMAPGQTLQLQKQHSFKPVSTRTCYPGEHGIELLINGRSRGRVTFVLKQ